MSNIEIYNNCINNSLDSLQNKIFTRVTKLQNTIFSVNNNVISKTNFNYRVDGSMNKKTSKFKLSSILLSHTYTNVNVTRIKFTKFRKRNKLFDELRVDFYVFFFFFNFFFFNFFVEKPAKKKKNFLKKIFFELKR